MKQLTFESSGKSILETTFVVIDCETTGLNPKSDAITEIAAIKICGGKPIGTFHSLINPKQQLSTQITSLTGITNEQLKDCPTFDELVPTFLEFIADCVIVGHNVRFDIGFINAGFKKAGYLKLKNPYLDTLSLAKKLIPTEVPNFKLATLAQYCKAETSPTHRAFADVQATIEVFHYLIERSSSIGVAGIKDLFTLPSIKKRERFIKRHLSANAPSEPGVYMFVSDTDEILYVGTSRNIRKRLYSYFVSDDRARISKMISKSSRIEYITTPTQVEARIAELRLLQSLAPEYNIADVRPSRMNYVVAQSNEVAPTFRVQPTVSKTDAIVYGPFTSKRTAMQFCEAVQYVFGLRKCTNICKSGKKSVTSPCINSLRGIHSCFCSDEWETITHYTKNFKKLATSFEHDYPIHSARLIGEMKSHADKLHFEKAQKIYGYAIIIQKWMNRLAAISDASKLIISESQDIPEVVFGLPKIRFRAKQSTLSSNKAVSIIKKYNALTKVSKSPSMHHSTYYISDAIQFRERHYVASFLARNSLRIIELNNDTQIAVVADHKNIKATTIL